MHDFSLKSFFIISQPSQTDRKMQNKIKRYFFILLHTYISKHKNNYTLILQEPVTLDPRLAALKIFMIFRVYCS